MVQFEPSDRVELVSTTDEHTTLEPGARGTVSSVQEIEEPIGPQTQVWVDWDGGGKLAMLLGEDEIRKVGDPGGGADEIDDVDVPAAWSEVRRGIPPNEHPSVPDDAVDWLNLIQQEGDHFATVYRTDDGEFILVVGDSSSGMPMGSVAARGTEADVAPELHSYLDRFGGRSGPDLDLEDIGEAEIRAYCRAVGGETFETSGGTLTCEVAGGRVFGTAGEIVVELRPDDDLVIRATPEVGVGRDLRVTAPASRWELAQTVDDGNLLTVLRTKDDVDVDVDLGVYGPEAHLAADGIEVVGVDPDEVLLEHG